MNDKYTDSDIRIENAALKKLEHFWFYYKWHTMAILFVVFVLSVCFVQSCTKTDYDVTIVYAGPYEFTKNETTEAMLNELDRTLPKDFNKDGEKAVGFVSYQVLTKEQIEDMKKELEALKESGVSVGTLDTGYFSSQSNLFHSAMQSGEYAILLLDPSLYEGLKSVDGRLRKLSEVLVSVPKSALDEYGIRFSETALYRSSSALAQLPEDTVLCLASPLVFGLTSKSAEYAKMVEMFAVMAED